MSLKTRCECCRNECNLNKGNIGCERWEEFNNDILCLSCYYTCLEYIQKPTKFDYIAKQVDYIRETILRGVNNDTTH